VFRPDEVLQIFDSLEGLRMRRWIALRRRVSNPGQQLRVHRRKVHVSILAQSGPVSPGQCLGAAGAAWLVEGPLHDPIGGLLALATTALAGASGPQPATAYSYIIEAKRALSDRSAQKGWRPQY
jgi:hypothetical protein